MAETVLLLGHGRNGGLKLAGTLKSLGFQPAAASWGGFSLRAYSRANRPRLIIADADQPSAVPMAEFCRRVRQLWGEKYPIIAVTSSSRFQDLSALLDAGASVCLPRSAPPELTARRIGRCLEEAAPAPAPDELADAVPESLLGMFSAPGRLVRLGELADVYVGAAPRRAAWRRLAPPDAGWRGVLTAEAVGRFHTGRPSSYLSWNRLHLFRMPPPHEYAVPEKVLLRRAGPPLAAAVDRSRLPAGTDVYSVVPREGVSAGYIACLLNSRMLDFYFNRVARTGADGRLRPEDIRHAPVPVPHAAACQELSRCAALLTHFGPHPEGWIDRQSREEILEEMENAVFRFYGAPDEVRAQLEALHF